MNELDIEQHLKKSLQKLLPNHLASEPYYYSLFPAGKFFRPKLVWSIFKDLGGKDLDLQNHFNLSSAVEIHHAYSLAHDDLPAMDNDDTRRGKPSLHKQFGEWKAILTGDGLLNLSYQLMAQINHPRAIELIKLFSWSMGPKGLIHGQYLDLSEEMTVSLESTFKTHELKTARLIQFALTASALLTNKTPNYYQEKNIWKYGKLLGVNFQFLDDLTELQEKTLTAHELSVNPWIKFPEQTKTLLIQNLNQFEILSKKLPLKHTDAIVKNYYESTLKIVEGNQKTIEGHLKIGAEGLDPVMLILQRFNR